jgi:Na+/melibiose symporter-like transporter
MTKEQWFLYLYSIYPDRGFIVFMIIIIGLIALVFFLTKIHDSHNEEKEKAQNNAEKFARKYFYVSIVIIAILMLLPSKKMAVAIYFTPDVIKYLDSNNTKLDKIDDILDLAIDKAIKNLKENQ